MHDFDLVRDGQRFAAVEVTAAADAASIELWKLLNGGGRWIQGGLAGGWMVSLIPTSRARFCPADHCRSQSRIAAAVTVPWKT